MKIAFEDKSFIEFRKSDKEGFVLVIIQAKDSDNHSKKITNSAEISVSQLQELMQSVS